METSIQAWPNFSLPHAKWMLPDAKTPAESVVVMLDWCSGHLTKEVAEVVRRKGHVLLFHGGGCTPFTQINDTHLHSKLKDEMTHGERLQYQYVAREHSLSRPAGQPQLGSMFTGLGQRSLMVEYPEDDSAQYMCRSCLAARFIYN